MDWRWFWMAGVDNEENENIKFTTNIKSQKAKICWKSASLKDWNYILYIENVNDDKIVIDAGKDWI